MARAARVLLVEDDELLAATLTDQFAEHREFDVETVSTGGEALKKLRAEGHIDLVLLDVGLPDMDGRDACKRLRESGFKSPIIMLTGADDEKDVVTGLDAGANDYVTKPFKFAVLLARLRAHLRSHEQSEDAVFKIGPYEFKPAVKMLVAAGDRRIKLTEKEASILKYLYRAGGQPVSRDTLLDEVWGYNSGVTTHTLETHVYRLRQKIEPEAGKTTLLMTDSGGYRLNFEA
ncbi:response regulator transcription factor [Parvularcula dongshanensis]|uniref:DNA-binding response OmpR family regulator n=1 Tax=Parvularcula dongshanensis TaxID=1173995 RepID=A0A840HZQ6_9PROT|nr:response regulator transcription factor [Parvularcula dongshanensis]MBB4658059.1 DNA-binding response OmpR family regulator [Parvularcula dongshanensis]